MAENLNLTGLYIRVDSRVIKHFTDNIEGKEKSDVCIDFDGEVKKFTLQEFKERMFKEESQEESCENEQLQFQLKRPLQALLIAGSESMAKIIKGEKKTTLREGHRDYKAGKVVFVITSEFGKAAIAVIKQITRVEWKLLKEVTEEEIVAYGFNNIEDMLTSLRAFYPEIGLDSPITVIEWK